MQATDVKQPVNDAIDDDEWNDDTMNSTNHERTVRVLEGGMSCQNRIVRFDYRTGQLRSRIDAEFQLGLFAVVSGEAFQKESTEPGTGSATEGVEDEETLKSRAVVGQTTKFLHDGVD